jgi:hypothetical protein
MWEFLPELSTIAMGIWVQWQKFSMSPFGGRSERVETRAS